jgi:hypothetical protein
MCITGVKLPNGRVSATSGRVSATSECVARGSSLRGTLASNKVMGRSAWGARGCAAVALMAGSLAVTASAQQASAQTASAGSTRATGQQPQPRDSTTGPPVSIERVREGLKREPALRLDVQPVFRLEVRERRPRYWDLDLQSPFLFPVEPRASSTRWHNEFLAMVTPQEASAYSPMFTTGELVTVAATSLLFAGATELVTDGFQKWGQARKKGKQRAAKKEVDEAILEWEFANPRPAPSQ